MPNISFDAAARAGANARAFVQQLGKQAAEAAEGSAASTEGAASFGEMLLQRQQALSGGPVAQQVVLPEPLPFNLSTPASAPAEPAGVELNPVLVSEVKLQTPSRAAESQPTDGAAITTDVMGPDGKTGNAFGHWEMKSATRPYAGLKDSDLDDWQRDTVEKWKVSPYNLIWKYDVEPAADNNWAGWGPPPDGWMTRSEIPRTAEGAFLGAKLPWPPAGEPRGGWIKQG